MDSLNNIGLMVYNLTRLPTNETCDAGGGNCKYSMTLRFWFSEKPDVLLFTLPTLIWVIQPGQSKMINIYEDVGKDTSNPLRVEIYQLWNAASGI